MYLQRAKRYYESELYGEFGAPRGASDREIMEVEGRLGRVLPAAFREYLRWMGNDFEGIFRGTDCFLRDVEANTEWLPSFLEECGVVFADTATVICFWCHQGCVAVWFHVDGDVADPECWGLTDDGKPVRSVGRFSEYIERCLVDLRRAGQPDP